jgi:flagellar hook-associated protein 1 FlgK
MGLAQAITSALAGLQTTQSGMALIAENVANANTPGYIRKTLLQSSSAANGQGTGVRVLGITRDLDLFVQRQLRAELGGASYAGVTADYYSRLDAVFGQPGSQNALDTLFNNLTSALQALTASPESSAARVDTLNQAQVLAQHLNAMSGDVQELRSEAESAISEAVNRVNMLLQDIEQTSNKIISSNTQDIAYATLQDQRDRDVSELSGLLDIRVVPIDGGQLSIFTTSGISLFDSRAAHLDFDAQPAVNAQAAWDADPSKCTVGTLTLTSPSGDRIDLIANHALRSGAIAAHLAMRDQILVGAEKQLDEIANALALSLSNHTVAGTAVTGVQSGFELDAGSLLNGNTISLTYTDNGGGIQHKVTIVRVNDPATLPLDSSVTPDPNDEVIGIDFSGGIASVVTQLNTALGATGLVFSNPSGNTLRVLDDGVPDLVDVDALSASVTTDTFNSGDPTLPFFIDGGSNTVYSDGFALSGPLKLGFAARIAVNSALLADPTKLVAYFSNTQAGDSTRPAFLQQQLTGAAQLFDSTSGIGSTTSPFSGTIVDFIRQAISHQGVAADNASRLKEGQDVVVNALQQRFNDRSGVNIDTEMANLLTLQNAYGANARVMTTIKEMFDLLMKI